MKYCVVGHGNYPDGVLSALRLLLGTTKNIEAINLNEDITHDKFEQKILDLVDKEKEIIFFADLTGGAPYQIIANIILSNNQQKYFIIGSTTISIILDLYSKIEMLGVVDNYANLIMEAIEESKSLITVLPMEMKHTQPSHQINDEIDGGI